MVGFLLRALLSHIPRESSHSWLLISPLSGPSQCSGHALMVVFFQHMHLMAPKYKAGLRTWGEWLTIQTASVLR